MFINGIVFIVLAVIIRINRIWVKIASFVFLGVNLILTVTDQMGVLDYVVLILNIVTIISLILYARVRCYIK
jgi:hypothetical protein